MTTSAQLASIIASSRVIVCCGPGGVGKTTSAAAIGIASAITGRRTCVITVDPSRRLADALALANLANAPEPIDGPWTGSLDAMALDARKTFDDLVRRYSSQPDQVERILENRLYRNLVSTLSGTQEYMATEKLHELLESGRYDLVVVDTPPSRNALDFLAAPDRLTSFLDNRVMRLLLAPARRGLHAAGLASELVLRNLGRVAGKTTVEDAIAFFRAFSGMEGGFRDRAASVGAIIASPETSFVLVATPRADTIRELVFFAEAIGARGLNVAAAILNRVEPDFGPPLDGANAIDPASVFGVLSRNLADLHSIVVNETVSVDDVRRRIHPAPLTLLPLASSDIHDLPALEELARRMLSGTVR